MAETTQIDWTEVRVKVARLDGHRFETMNSGKLWIVAGEYRLRLSDENFGLARIPNYPRDVAAAMRVLRKFLLGKWDFAFSIRHGFPDMATIYCGDVLDIIGEGECPSDASDVDPVAAAICLALIDAAGKEAGNG